jgi:hypothetical protein
MRTCPSVEGSATPLITHRIGVDVCMARQRTFFHKCHRCVYRGQPANWEPETPLAMLNVHAAEEPGDADVRLVDLARAEPAAPPATAAAAPAPRKKPAKKPAAAKAARPKANPPATVDVTVPAPAEAAL